MLTQTEFICPNCLAGAMLGFLKLEQVPVHSVMNIHSKQAAIDFPRGDIHLGFCRVCGFISNMAFDPNKIQYSQDCEESQGFSGTFNDFLNKTASDLVNKYNVTQKKIIEIGCGKGDFLRLLCRIGKNNGIGIDPAYDPDRDDNSGPMPPGLHLDFIQDYYSQKYHYLKGDMICCRMTLEHIHNPFEFVSLLRSTLGDSHNTIVFFQVPNTLRILELCAFEDIYYEHCSYFTPGSFARLFHRCGFDILDLATVYDDQYIVLEARPANTPFSADDPENDLDRMESQLISFIEAYTTMLRTWESQLRTPQELSHQPKIVLWGSGSKAVSFLNALKITDIIQYVVDINPHRQGTFMAGTGQEIVAPEFLKMYKPDRVIIMNRMYKDEITQMIMDMGLKTNIQALGDTLYG